MSLELDVRYLHVPDVARIYQVDKSVVRKWIEDGLLEAELMNPLSTRRRFKIHPDALPKLRERLAVKPTNGKKKSARRKPKAVRDYVSEMNL